MVRKNRFNQELKDRAVRLVLEHQEEYDTQWQAICSIAEKSGCSSESLRRWLRMHEGQGNPAGESAAAKQERRIFELERENRELRRTNEILRLASAFFAQAELDRELK